MIISTIQWNTDDICDQLKSNGYEGNDSEIEDYLNDFDMRYFEEKCIQFGWEILRSKISENTCARSELIETYGAVDISLICDVPLFVDPMLIFKDI